MKARGLPARIGYVVVATPAACVGGFYLGIWVLTRALPSLYGVQDANPGWQEFLFSLLVGGAAGFTTFFYALTLPWGRLRRRRGRTWRMAASALIVLVPSVMAAAEGVPLRYVAVLMVWLAVVLTFTFVRYGVLDRYGRRGAEPTRASSL